MKKALKLLLFILLVLIILINSKQIIESIRFSFSICINNLFPSLIPFMIISNILIDFNFISDISDAFSKIIKIFKVNGNCSFIFIMSILSGTPGNAKYIKDLLENKMITLNDANNCLNFCHFTNPIFILGTIGLSLFNNKKIGLIILISHYLSSIIIGLFNKKNKDCLLSMHNNKKNKTSIIKSLTSSIYKTINTLLLILGIITTSLIITTLIDSLINIPNNYKFLYGIFEMTQGLKYLSLTSLNTNIKAIIASFMISFGGFCIHAQVFSIIDTKKIRYLPYFTSRLIHGIIASIICFLIIQI